MMVLVDSGVLEEIIKTIKPFMQKLDTEESKKVYLLSTVLADYLNSCGVVGYEHIVGRA